MHAASVHPEPGSNSRSVCINTRCKQVLFPASRTNLFLLRAFALSFLYSLLSIVSLRIFEFRISHILSFSMLCTSSLFLLFICQGSLPPLGDSLYIVPRSSAFVKGFFKSFFDFFSCRPTSSWYPAPALRDSSYILSPFP